MKEYDGTDKGKLKFPLIYAQKWANLTQVFGLSQSLKDSAATISKLSLEELSGRLLKALFLCQDTQVKVSHVDKPYTALLMVEEFIFIESFSYQTINP